MKLHISPCPNDTFIFHAMIHRLVDTEGLSFDVTFEDIDQLNYRACHQEADIIKISYATLPLLGKRYTALRVGGAIGYGNGPVLVARCPDLDLSGASIAVPGLNTTAAMLFRRLFADTTDNLQPYLFSEIAAAVHRGEVDAGVLIHEGRFTFAEHGLSLIADLGELWSQRYALPIPLGVIMVRQGLDSDKISRIIRRSIEFAMSHPDVSAEFVETHAAELSDEVRQKHISYFVNEFSLDIGKLGQSAIATLLGC